MTIDRNEPKITAPKSLQDLFNEIDKNLQQSHLVESLRNRRKVNEINKRLKKYIYFINKPSHIDEGDLKQEITTVIKHEFNMNPIENPWLAPFRLQKNLIELRQQLIDKLDDKNEDDEDIQLAKAQIETIDMTLKKFEKIFESESLQSLKGQADLIDIWIEKNEKSRPGEKPHLKNKGITIALESAAEPVILEPIKDGWHSFKSWLQEKRNKTPKYEHQIKRSQVHTHRETIEHEINKCKIELTKLVDKKLYPALHALGNKSSKKLTKQLQKNAKKISDELKRNPIEKDSSGQATVVTEIEKAQNLNALLKIKKEFQHKHHFLIPWQRTIENLEKAVNECNSQLTTLSTLVKALYHDRHPDIFDKIILEGKKILNKSLAKKNRDIRNLNMLLADLFLDQRSMEYGQLNQGNLDGIGAIRLHLKELQIIEEAFTKKEAFLKNQISASKTKTETSITALATSAADKDKTIVKASKHVVAFHPRKRRTGSKHAAFFKAVDKKAADKKAIREDLKSTSTAITDASFVGDTIKTAHTTFDFFQSPPINMALQTPADTDLGFAHEFLNFLSNLSS